MSEPLRSHVGILLPEQTHELLHVPVRVGLRTSASDASHDIVSAIATILQTKVILVCEEEGVWRVHAEAGEGPAIPPVATVASQLTGRVCDGPTTVVDCWTSTDDRWTLLGLARRSAVHAVLMLSGDWTASVPTLEQLGENLLYADRMDALSAAAHARLATHRLTRALARSTGYARVAEVAVRSAARAVRAELATIAIADAENQALRIMATHGYPLNLVGHMRIERGSGVMGSVYQTGLPVCVKDAAAVQAATRRSRYRTDSFVAAPIATGQEVLGVLCVTDRRDGRAFTRSDLSMLRALAAPLALALERERALFKAGSYARAAAIDPVSGLFNRRYFYARLDEELQRAHRHALSVGLLMIDVDDFKSINDSYGHLVGDAVLRTISDILRRSVRVFDVCTRFGGEEFAVVMPGSEAADAARIAERIRQRVQNYSSREPDLASLKFTVSVGYAVSSPETSPRDLISAADVALYQAKRTGKNQVRAVSEAAPRVEFAEGRTKSS